MNDGNAEQMDRAALVAQRIEMGNEIAQLRADVARLEVINRALVEDMVIEMANAIVANDMRQQAEEKGARLEAVAKAARKLVAEIQDDGHWTLAEKNLIAAVRALGGS